MNQLILRIDRLCGFASAAAAILLGASATAAPPAPEPAAGAAAIANFNTFQVIPSLNIFNANRTGPVDDRERPHVDTISLVGTMDSDQGRMAFFDSADAAFRKVVREGEKIAEFTVTKIETSRVELTRNSKSSSMAMGQQLRRPPGGDWELGNAPPVEAAPAAAAAQEISIPAGADADIVNKMMQRRSQQLKQ